MKEELSKKWLETASFLNKSSRNSVSIISQKAELRNKHKSQLETYKDNSYNNIKINSTNSQSPYRIRLLKEIHKKQISALKIRNQSYISFSYFAKK